MAKQTTDSKRLLSHTIAEWACALKYEDLSPEAIQAAKLFWFDSIGCALGGSQQEDAKILLKHYRAMSSGNGKATALVSGFKTNPDYKILFEPSPRRVRVKFNGEIIADSTNAHLLFETRHLPVYYFPCSDVRMSGWTG